MSAPPVPADQGTTHPGLLTEIMSNTLDQDYQVAAARQERDSGRGRPSGRVVVAIVVLAFGGMIGVSALRTEQERPVAAAERDQLVDQIHQRQHHLDLLHARLAALESAVASQQSVATAARGREQDLASALTSIETVTGLSAVSGPGIEIIADDAPGALGSGEGGVILDSDLQSLVNALWMAGAEAVAINGHRLTSLSAIRFAGRAITVDYRSLTPPYVVDAIGNPDTLPARLLETPGGQAWLGLEQNYGIRFETATKDDLELPGDSGAQVRQATPVGAR